MAGVGAQRRAAVRPCGRRPAQAPQQFVTATDNHLAGSFGGTYLRGNVDQIALHGGLESKLHHADRHALYAAGALDFVAFDGTPKVEKLNGSLLYAYELRDWFNPYVQSTHAHNRFLELGYRTTNGVGVCFHSFAGEWLHPLLLSFTPTVEYELFSDDSTDVTGRGTFRLNVGVPLHPNVTLASDAFHVPALGDLSDYRIYAELTARFTLIPELLSSHVTVADEHDSAPRSGVGSNDFTLLHSLVIHLGW